MAILQVCVARLGLPADKLSEQTSVIAKPKGLKQSPVQKRKSQDRPRLHAYTTSATADLRPAP